ncbi:MAG: MEMO1 family protein [Halobacteriota archaeon]|nr:MEMO1 family protein [Halobacteriota archaeon]
MRRPAFAGQFYSGNDSDLRRDLKGCFSDVEKSEKDVIAAVVPHAGHIYSGNVAAHVYSKLPDADTYVIIGPSHRGGGSMIAVSKDTWATPLGAVEVDHEFIEELPKSIIDTDEIAHSYEHSIEVQLPFLQYLFDEFKIVPISLGLQDEETSKEVGKDVAETVKKLNKKIVILASSDFTHYMLDEVAREIDSYVIEPILDLNVSKFYTRVYNRNATVCGVGPIAATLYASIMLDAKKGMLIKYATSGDVDTSMREVVGYAGIIIV